jgi:lipoic acid synthetase
LSDGGASQFAATVEAVRARLPGAQVEVLTPDFKASTPPCGSCSDPGPTCSITTSRWRRACFPSLRSASDYARSLALLRHARTLRPGQVTKSGLMLGLGETDAEVRQVLADLGESGVAIVTLGQYLRPTRDHAPVARYVPPSEFERWAG